VVLVDPVVEGAQGDHHAGLDVVAGRGLDDLDVLQLVLELADARLHQALLVLGGVVLGVLRDVAELAGPEEALGDRGPGLALHLLELTARPPIRVEGQSSGGLLPGLARRALGRKVVLVHSWNLAAGLRQPSDRCDGEEPRAARGSGRPALANGPAP